jgi:endonuclease YncB( thermonuclease family)
MFSRNQIETLAAHARRTLSAALGLLLAAAAPAEGGARLDGPIPALVTRIIDGDTIEVRAQIWLEQEIVVKVRLAGVDAPEMTAACAEARQAAQLARDLVAREVEGARVMLTEIHGGKYFGRVIGRIVTPKGEDLSSLLLAAGLATPYSGGRRSAMC